MTVVRIGPPCVCNKAHICSCTEHTMTIIKMVKKNTHVKEASKETVSQLPMGKETFSLYIRAPSWITNREKSVAVIKDLNQRIINVRFPRQKSAHFGFIDFSTADDRDKAFTELKKIPAEKKIYVTQVTRDKPQLLAKRVEIVQAKRESKNEVKKLFKRVSQNEKNQAKPNQSNKIIIINVPRNTTAGEITTEFSNAMSVKLNFPTKATLPGKAVLTLPTPADAIAELKRLVTIHNTKLSIRLLTKDPKGKKTTKSEPQQSAKPQIKIIKKKGKKATAKKPGVKPPTKKPGVKPPTKKPGVKPPAKKAAKKATKKL